MTDAIARLRLVKAQADSTEQDRLNYQWYIADRVENGGWTAADVDEYKREVARIMKSGTDDEKAAAREFLALKAEENRSSAN